MEKVTDKARITTLLQKLLEQRALLGVTPGAQTTPFTSAVIGVNRNDGFFVLDELKPDGGNGLLKQTPQLRLEGHLDGVVIRFDATVREFGTDGNIPFYKLPIPAALEYHQRRQSVRIRLSAAHPLRVSFSSEDGARFEAEIEDISIGGLRARFKKDLPHSLEAGMMLQCSFVIPPDNNEKINSSLVIRVIKHRQEGTRAPFLGGQFLSMEKQMERQLQRAIMTLQRALRQKDVF